MTLKASSPFPQVRKLSADYQVGKTTVTLEGLTHPNPADLEITLAAPDGTCVILLQQVPGGPLENATLTFDDSAGGTLAAGADGLLASGTYQPTQNGTANDWPAPAPYPPYATSLAAFDGINPNGEWYLRIGDAGVGSGVLTKWSINITDGAYLV
jgi:subtilisin-like proprotein convertase family protein